MPAPWPEPGFARPADLAACRAMLQGGSRTFAMAARLLPADRRMAATALYAFCRLADDAVDVEGGGPAAVARLQRRLDRAYAGRPDDAPADRALADVLLTHAIPPALPEALLEGFLWDAQGRRYAQLADVQAYAARVAGTVGAMMALIMGVRDPVVLARAAELGVAMQLTNIARDVGEDAARNRLYLPVGWLAEAGIDAEAWLAGPAFSPALAGVVGRLLGEAEALYARSGTAIGALPGACRPGMHAARLGYREIGQELARRGLDSVNARAMVPGRRRARVMAAALVATVASRPLVAGPPLPAIAYLVDAVAAAPARRRGAATVAATRWVWVLQLFEQLEHRQRARAAT